MTVYGIVSKFCSAKMIFSQIMLKSYLTDLLVFLMLWIS